MRGALLALACAVFVPGGAAFAGDVRGQVKLDPNRPGKALERNRGFVERIENPIRPVKKFSPWSEMIVVLEDGPVDEKDKIAPGPAVRYRVMGTAFEAPILAVVAGSDIELFNAGHRTIVLESPDDPNLLEGGTTIKPKRKHKFKFMEPNKPTVIKARDASVPRGRVIAFPHRYFAKVDRRGRFEIKNVPAGNWKARVWYRGGWIEGAEKSFEVTRRRGEVTIKIAPNQVRKIAMEQE